MAHVTSASDFLLASNKQNGETGRKSQVLGGSQEAQFLGEYYDVALNR